MAAANKLLGSSSTRATENITRLAMYYSSRQINWTSGWNWCSAPFKITCSQLKSNICGSIVHQSKCSECISVQVPRSQMYNPLPGACEGAKIWLEAHGSLIFSFRLCLELQFKQLNSCLHEPFGSCLPAMLLELTDTAESCMDTGRVASTVCCLNVFQLCVWVLSCLNNDF